MIVRLWRWIWGMDYWDAACSLLYPKIPHTLPSYLGGTLAECDAALATIKALRAEYSSIHPPRFRRKIMEWLRYFEREIKGNRRDVVSQRSRREQEKFRAGMVIEQRRTRELLAKVKS